jgi:hypothetical protein
MIILHIYNFSWSPRQNNSFADKTKFDGLTAKFVNYCTYLPRWRRRAVPFKIHLYMDLPVGVLVKHRHRVIIWWQLG